MKIQSPWMGRVRGSAGNMTGCKIYDKNVMRAKAFEVSNPNTAAQQTERSFFAQVAECCASVSEEQLRSLFGVKPKSMSRRNELTKQVSKAYSIDGTSKTLDFSKLLSIGNGEKVNTPIAQITNGITGNDDVIQSEMFGDIDPTGTNFIVVVFDSDNNTIHLVNTNLLIEEIETIDELVSYTSNTKNGFYYPTCAVGGGNVSRRGFGSFIIKTRAEK